MAKDLSRVDVTLQLDRLYEQVAGDFGTESLGVCRIPLQAADYWSRIRRHREAGDFARYSYFPGITLRVMMGH